MTSGLFFLSNRIEVRWPAPISPSPTSRASSALRVECTKCDRKGRYHVHKLIEKYGRQGNMMKWREMLNADCPNAGCYRAAIAGRLRPGVPRPAEGALGLLVDCSPWTAVNLPALS
jgi:hypothetical protein